MSSALFAKRALPLVARARSQPVAPRALVRHMHIENTAETSLPFPSGPTRKAGVAIGLASFMIGGFSLPFVAAWFQIAKAG